MRLPRLLRRRSRPAHLFELLGGPGAGQLVAAEPLDDRFDAELRRHLDEARTSPLLGRLPARWPGSGAPMTWDGLPVYQDPSGGWRLTP